MSVLLLFHFLYMSDLIVVRDTRKLAKIELPSFPGSQVEIYQESQVGAIRSLQNVADNFEKAIRLLISNIKDWNLAEEANGEVVKMPITIEVIDKFREEDLMLMLATSQGLSVDELKKRGQEILAGGNVKKNLTAG